MEDLDRDYDGKISKEEFDTFLNKEMSKMKR